MGWKKMVVTARNNQEESYWRRRNTMADISVEEVWNRIACSDPVLGWKEHGQTVQTQVMSGDRYVICVEDFHEMGRAEQTFARTVAEPDTLVDNEERGQAFRPFPDDTLRSRQ
jgi:hypothetical protein